MIFKVDSDLYTKLNVSDGFNIIRRPVNQYNYDYNYFQN